MSSKLTRSRLGIFWCPLLEPNRTEPKVNRQGPVYLLSAPYFFRIFRTFSLLKLYAPLQEHSFKDMPVNLCDSRGRLRVKYNNLLNNLQNKLKQVLIKK